MAQQAAHLTNICRQYLLLAELLLNERGRGVALLGQ